MTALVSDAFVFFGATGDLAFKKIFPALQSLIRRGRMHVPIIGVAIDNLSLDQFKTRARNSLEQHAQFDSATYETMCQQLKYVSGDYREPETYQKIRTALGTAQRPLNYLAITPSLFGTVAEGLAKSGCVHGARVIVEKPFGRDLESARDLNRILHEYFPEESIFRIDHYLGKEPVQNLIYYRFANPLIDAAWNSRNIESVQITMAENFGVAGRGKFYEEAGAIRDVVQNHMLQVIACLAMECPVSQDHEARRDARGKLLEAVRTLKPADIVRGQFQGYRNEPGVNPASQVETFAAVRFMIDNARWDGVPFFVRAGKCLPVTTTEVMVRFKRRPHPMLDDSESLRANYYRFRLSPQVVIALGTKVKKVGELMKGEAIELVATHQAVDEMDPYDRLLGDAAFGDAALFARQDSVESSWRIVEPILGNMTPLHEYEPNTWGPPEATSTIIPDGGWHDPDPQPVSSSSAT
ncbi:glucose-6-phosphate dehydrogenase [Schlesneria paludicola]|uniref:glucose-6-phosphate dehydrogenase n=1 Tax=Schlesneria paludicola TaxID=360056 RepID=UPI000299FA2C|nr:glucose-6-phosphate dehydrogenase [Schlesneria paludicola]